MARMSRDDLAKATTIFGMQPKDVQKESDADKTPEKNCGVCKHFLETAYMSDGRGSCAVLKQGSDITSDPPVFNLDFYHLFTCFDIFILLGDAVESG